MLNRTTNWACRKGVTETPLATDNLLERIADFARLTLSKDRVALNYTHLVLMLSPYVSVGTPGDVLVELVNPNLDGPFQLVQEQALSWTPGSGLPCLMIFNIHHQLSSESDPFRIRVTNNGIPTTRNYCSCHAYWGFELSTRARCYINEPAQRIDLNIGYLKSHLRTKKQVTQYVQYTLDTSRMDRNPQNCTKSAVNVIPEAPKPPVYVVSAPAASTGSLDKDSALDKWLKGNRAADGETNKPRHVDSLSESSDSSTKKRRSQKRTSDTNVPIKPDPKAMDQ